MFPATPNKKVFTDNIKSSIDTSNTHRDTFIPEDLNLALQNLGSRVRKSVTEGYNLQQRVALSTPATPFSSPVKPNASQSNPTPIFRSANDAFSSVYPAGGSQSPLTPSPRKRSRAATDLGSYNDDMALDSDEEDDIELILGPDASSGGVQREIKPLRRSAHTRSSSSLMDPFTYTAQTMASSSSSSEDSMDVCGEAIA